MFKYLILIISISFTFLHASVNEILPTYHVDYLYLEMLQARGLCLELNQFERPYTKGQVAQSLLNISDTLSLTTVEKQIIAYLKRDLQSEIQTLKHGELNSIKFQTYSTGYLDKTQTNNVTYRGIYHLGGGLRFGSHIYIANNYVSNQYDYYDPYYTGKKWRGFAAYTEEAYFNIVYKHFQLKFGRDFIRWGIGESGTLVLSNNTMPLDQLYFNFKMGPFFFSFITSQLNSIVFSDSTGRYQANRFLVGHRLGINLWNKRLQAAISEIIIYGGPNTFFNLTYLNPFIFYHGAKKNGAPDNNVLPSLDLLFYPISNWQIYGSILIDDIQLDKKTPGDLEPNEIAWLVGSKYADPFSWDGITISAEYVRVANRTYLTPFPWERFSYRGRCLGYPLGNDLEYFQIGLDKWFNSKFFIKSRLSFINKGEGDVFGKWDEPWMNYTVEQGYHEKFPTGIVEKTEKISLFAQYNPSHLIGVNADIHYLSIKNNQHIQGHSRTDFLWRLGIRLNFQYLRHFKD